MKNTFFYFIFSLPQMIVAQSLYPTNGVQCGTHGSGGCEHYQSPCPIEATAEIRFALQTDGQATETSWQLIDETDNGSTVGEGTGLQNHTTYVHSFCAFIDHCYQLTINDSGGNGIASDEGYTLYWNGDLLQSGGDFGASEMAEWGGCCTEFLVTLKGGIACTSNAFGQVFAEIDGGSPPFQYVWSSGESFIEVLPVAESFGSIAVTVTDAAGCTANATFESDDLTGLAVEVETTPITAGPNTGTATAIINSGVPPFTYQWSNGGDTKTIFSIPTGAYEVTVTDGSGCTATAEGPVIDSVKDRPAPIFDLQCFPNPADKLINVTFTASTTEKGILQIANASGIVVLMQTITIIPGKNAHRLNVADLPSGQYWVGVQIATFREFKGVQLVD